MDKGAWGLGVLIQGFVARGHYHRHVGCLDADVTNSGWHVTGCLSTRTSVLLTCER